jgi:hypothetical protein
MTADPLDTKRITIESFVFTLPASICIAWTVYVADRTHEIGSNNILGISLVFDAPEDML